MILIIDDHDATNCLFEVLIKSKGLEVKSFSGANNAISWLEEGNKPSLIFCDIHMPDGTGNDLVDWLKEKEVNIPLVLISANHYADFSGLPRLLKPLYQEDIFNMIGKFL